jgi:hypothetical protein
VGFRPRERGQINSAEGSKENLALRIDPSLNFRCPYSNYYACKVQLYCGVEGLWQVLIPPSYQFLLRNVITVQDSISRLGVLNYILAYPQIAVWA